MILPPAPLRLFRPAISLLLALVATTLSAASAGGGAEGEAVADGGPTGDAGEPAPRSFADQYPVTLRVDIYDDVGFTWVSGFFDDDGWRRAPPAADVFEATCGDQHAPLERHSGAIISWGEEVPDGAWAEFEGALSGGTSCVFRYEAEAGSSAPLSPISLPAALVIAMPEDTVFLDTDDLRITWTGGEAGDVVRFTLEDAELQDEPYVFEADAAAGELVIPAGTLVPIDDSFSLFSTNAWPRIDLLHTEATLDDGYAHGGSITVARHQDPEFQFRP